MARSPSGELSKAMYEETHPLADLRRELAEIVAQGDAATLADLLRGEGLPPLGGHAAPAELIHGALMLEPDRDLTQGVGALVGSLLEQRAALLREQQSLGLLVVGGGGATGASFSQVGYPEDAGYVANCLRISELLPRQQELFEGVSRFFDEGFSLSALREDSEGLGRRLREALRWQQTSTKFEDYWLGLIRDADNRTDLLDGWSGILWLERPEVEPKWFERIDRALRAYAETSAKQVQQMALLEWAVRTLDEAYPSTARYWQEGLGQAAASWPPELLLVFQHRWPLFGPAADTSLDLPPRLQDFWQTLGPTQRDAVQHALAKRDPKRWESLMLDILLNPPAGMQSAAWARQVKELRKHFENEEPSLVTKRRLVLVEEAEEAGDLPEGDVLQQRENALKSLQRVDKVLAEVESQLAKGRAAQAAQFLRALLAWQKQNTEPEHTAKTYSRSATLYQRFGLLEQAQELLEEAIDLVPDDPVPRTGLAEVLKSRGELSEAERLYRETVTRFPSNEVARNGLAEVLKSRGELPEAERLYRETVTRFPSDVVARNGLAEVLKSRGELPEAERLYREAVTRFPSDVVARTGLAEVLKSRGELPEAERLYRETVTRFPSDVVARNGLANLLRHLRRFDDALALMPEPAQLKTLQDFINLHLRGMIFLSQGNLAEAKRLFEQGLEQCKLEGQRGYFRNALAVLALRQARWDDVDQLVSADASPVGKVLQFHARAGSGRAEDAGELARELEAAKILPFPVRRAFEGIRDGYDVFAPSGLRNPSAEEEEQIFEYEFEMLSSGIAA